MTANRSLDDFATPESGGDGDERMAEDPPDDESAAADPGDAGTHEATASGAIDEVASSPAEPTEADGAGPEPPTSTYAWHPDGDACDACGETVEERWRDGDGLVCAGCKEW